MKERHLFTLLSVEAAACVLFCILQRSLSGLFSKSKNGLVKGYIAGVLGRYFFAFLSGMIRHSSIKANTARHSVIAEK